MTIMRTMDDPTRPDAAAPQPPTFINTSTHWWDASQIYGTTPEYQQFVRTGQDGKLRVEPDGSLPLPPGDRRQPDDGARILDRPGAAADPVHPASTTPSATCCARHYPQLGRRGDLPARPARHRGAARQDPHRRVDAGRDQPPHDGHRAARQLVRARGRAAQRASSAGSAPARWSAASRARQPSTTACRTRLTEEFAAVYRMHPLIPDDWSMRATRRRPDARRLHAARLLGPGRASQCFGKVSMPTCSTPSAPCTPGWSRLHNFPRFLQEFVRPDGQLMDLAATDILRHRELGVPRYCEFRRLLHLDAPATFDELTDDRARPRQRCDELYDGDIEKARPHGRAVRRAAAGRASRSATRRSASSS